jgi:phage terminase large subunit
MLWESVIGGPKSGIEHNKADHIFRYPNGSVIYTGGMKDEGQREAIRSIGGKGAVDWIWVEEATAITLEDYQELLLRLRGTASPWLQIMLSTNPGPPNHWINQRLILGGEASVHLSGARDNPHNPATYLTILSTLTGTQKLRLVDGVWAQGEGVVYDNFSAYREGNVTDEADYNPHWPIVWGVDDGYAQGAGPGTESHHPRVFLLGQYTPQGGVNIFAEYYKTLEVEEKSIAAVLAMGYPRPDVAYVDSSAAQLKGRIQDESIQTSGGTHVVTEGIKNVRNLLCDGNDVRLIRIHPRCAQLIGEMQSYSRGDNKTAVAGEVKPLKLNDHGPDALRYMTWRLRQSTQS